MIRKPLAAMLRALPYLALSVLTLIGSAGHAAPEKNAIPLATPAAYREIATQVRADLQHDIVGMWFPRAVDHTGGGFAQDFQENWSPGPNTEKSVVYQSRLTWVAAQASLRYPRQASVYRADAKHGIDYLAHILWDQKQGGFFWAVDESGQPNTYQGTEKHAYGISFALYAAADTYRAIHDMHALDLAKRTFHWLDKHAHDARHGGLL